MPKAYHPFRQERISMQTAPPKQCRLLVGEGGFEPPKAVPADLQSVPFGHSGIPPYSLLFGRWSRIPPGEVELVDGLEPPTC